MRSHDATVRSRQKPVAPYLRPSRPQRRAPENTLPALEAAAARLGADVCEIDVVLTGDDEIVLLHDEILDRTTNGKGRVADSYSLAEFGHSTPDHGSTGALPGRACRHWQRRSNGETLGLALLVEIKERQRPDALIERLGVVLSAQQAIDDVLVISFDHPSLCARANDCPASGPSSSRMRATSIRRRSRVAAARRPLRSNGTCSIPTTRARSTTPALLCG